MPEPDQDKECKSASAPHRFQCPPDDILQPALSPQIRQSTLAAKGHPLLIKLFSFCIQAHNGIPEHAEHTHARAVIPNGSREFPAQFGNPAYLQQGLLRAGNEIEHKQ